MHSNSYILLLLKRSNYTWYIIYMVAPSRHFKLIGTGNDFPMPLLFCLFAQAQFTLLWSDAMAVLTLLRDQCQGEVRIQQDPDTLSEQPLNRVFLSCKACASTLHKTKIGAGLICLNIAFFLIDYVAASQSCLVLHCIEPWD